MEEIRTVRWPVRTWPQVLLAGQFAIDDRAFRVPYYAPTHALHLHDYTGRMRIGEQELELAAGDLTLTPAGMLSSFDLPVPGMHLCIHFAERGRTPGERMELPVHLRLGAWQQAASYKMMSIAELLSGRNAHPLNFAAAAAALQELLLWIVLQADALRSAGGRTRTEQAIEEAAALLVRDLGAPCSIPAIAREVGLSQNYLARHFRQRFGMTMKAYLLRKRIEQAQALLRYTDLPLKVIGARVGIADQQQFNKLMHRITGLSPSSVRSGGTTHA